MTGLCFGQKTDEYPFGYGYCQCGCGKKTYKLSNGESLKYVLRHKNRIYIREKIGSILPGYEKGWGLCQCGCGKKTTICWQTIRGKKLWIARKYYKYHYSKTEESRRKQSIVGTRVLKERDYSSFSNYGKSKHGLYFSKKLGYEIGYMSTYEELAFKILDNDPNIENYTPQPFAIGYNYKGIQKSYTPDILIHYKDGKKIIIEVKPHLLLEKSKNKTKQNWNH